MYRAPTLSSIVRLSLLALVASCSACHHGGGGGGGGGDGSVDLVNRLSTVVYDHANSAGGSDLFRAPIDGSSPQINLTNHRDTTTVVATWPEPVGERIVYVAEKNGAFEFHSTATTPPPAGATGFVQLSTIHAGTTDPDRWQVVGDRIVARVTDNGIDNLFSFAIDHAEARPLTGFTAPCTIVWPRDEHSRTKAVTDGGIVVFERHTATGSEVLGVAADGSAAGPNVLSTGDLATVAIDYDGSPMLTGDTVVVRDGTSLTTQFRAADATKSQVSKALTASLTDASVIVTEAGLLDGRFIYVERNAGDTDTLKVVRLDAPLAPSGDPQATQLTNFSNGEHIVEVSAVTGEANLGVVVSIHNAQGGIDAGVFSVRIDDPQTWQQLSRNTQTPTLADEVLDLTRCGRFLIYGRQAAPNAVFQAALGQPASEVELLPGQPSGFDVGVEIAIYHNRVVDPLSGVIMSHPTKETVDQVILYVTTDTQFTDYFSCTPTATGIRVDRLSNKAQPAGDVQIVKGESIVYQRGPGLYSARIGVPDSEINIFDAAGTVTSVFGREGQGADDRVLFFTDGNAYSTRVDQAAALARETHQVTEAPSGSTQVHLLFNSASRVVYTETDTISGRTVLVSSPLVADHATRTPLSDGFSSDTFRLAF